MNIQIFQDNKLIENHFITTEIDLSSLKSALDLQKKLKYQSSENKIVIEFKKDDVITSDISALIKNSVLRPEEKTEDDYFDERVKASLIRLGVIKEK